MLERKREALRFHRSQMERLMDDPRWVTLAEVADGRLLPLLLDSREVFVELP